jgi:hypothetical protein
MGTIAELTVAGTAPAADVAGIQQRAGVEAAGGNLGYYISRQVRVRCLHGELQRLPGDHGEGGAKWRRGRHVEARRVRGRR